MNLRNFLTLIIVAGIVFVLGKLSFSPTSIRTTTMHTNEVVLYATDWCPYCEKTRKFLKENNVAFTEFDIEKSAEGKKQYDQLQGKGIPLLIIRGKIIPGYNPILMESLLKIDSPSP